MRRFYVADGWFEATEAATWNSSFQINRSLSKEELLEECIFINDFGLLPEALLKNKPWKLFDGSF